MTARQVLVVVAHPCDDSFTHAAARAALDGLDRAGHRTDVIDLYAEGFRTAMSLDERLAYETPDPVLDDQVARYIALLRAADTIVFVYPTWWSGLPAILKGWLERVTVPGVGFTFDERTGKVRPGLTHLRRIVGVSTYGSPRRYVLLINDNGRRTLTRALKMAAGLRARTTWLGMYALDTSTADDRARFLEAVARRLERI